MTAVKAVIRHPWPRTTAAAVAVQQELRKRVIARDRLGTVRYVAGVDVGFEGRGKDAVARAAVVVLRLADLEPVDQAVVRRRTGFPYVPGLLSFRELPAVLDALERVGRTPDLVLCDGQGLAHPRRFGIACHLGVLLDVPAIGVAKSRLVGRHAEPGAQRGDWAPLWLEDKVVGAVLRTRVGTRPLYVSTGHRVGLETAIDYVMRCAPRYRLPETTRLADRLSRAIAVNKN